MGILEGTQVLWSSRIGRADLRWPNGEMCLPQATAHKEFFDCGRTKRENASAKPLIYDACRISSGFKEGLCVDAHDGQTRKTYRQEQIPPR